MSVVVVVPCDHTFGWEALVLHLWPSGPGYGEFSALSEEGRKNVEEVERFALPTDADLPVMGIRLAVARLGFPDLLQIFPALATREF
jgi:hypothetical protein